MGLSLTPSHLTANYKPAIAASSAKIASETAGEAIASTLTTGLFTR
ncbi:MAG: hypothetical protein SFY66_26905 [Oculatellaceae cyanobacterium bins.114]|nr:hypothetical protein [Oculatellaceae cyanobacterium bins.114]